MPVLTRYAMKLVLAAAITLNAACSTTTTTEYVQTPLPVPDRPTLPTVVADDLMCLGDEAYEALAVRDTQLQEHVRRLEAIIRTTHANHP